MFAGRKASNADFECATSTGRMGMETGSDGSLLCLGRLRVAEERSEFVHRPCRIDLVEKGKQAPRLGFSQQAEGQFHPAWPCDFRACHSEDILRDGTFTRPVRSAVLVDRIRGIPSSRGDSNSRWNTFKFTIGRSVPDFLSWRPAGSARLCTNGTTERMNAPSLESTCSRQRFERPRSNHSERSLFPAQCGQRLMNDFKDPIATAAPAARLEGARFVAVGMRNVNWEVTK